VVVASEVLVEKKKGKVISKLRKKGVRIDEVREEVGG